MVVSLTALVEWFSSDLGRPLTKSITSQLVPFQVSLVMIPELVSKPLSPLGPPHLGSLELT